MVDGIKHCEKRLPLKCHRSNFLRIWFSDLRFRTWGLEINHLKRTQLRVTRVFFLSLLSRKFDDRLSSNFHRFVILCIWWDTPTVKASLWQLPIVPLPLNFKMNPTLEYYEFSKAISRTLYMYTLYIGLGYVIWSATPSLQTFHSGNGMNDANDFCRRLWRFCLC